MTTLEHRHRINNNDLPGTNPKNVTIITVNVSNQWTGIWNGTVEWKMEWNSEHT